jgi:hypothetical protein
VSYRQQRRGRVVTAVVWTAAIAAGCSSSATTSPPQPTDASAPTSTGAVSTTAAPTTVPVTTVSPSTRPSTTAQTTTTRAPDLSALAGITATAVPGDVIVPTAPATLDPVTNPINGRRGALRPLATGLCGEEPEGQCLEAALDLLGFDVTSGAPGDRGRQVQRATAVMQLDADLPMTGVADETLLDYLDLIGSGADEVRQIGTSQLGRPITALRYGTGERVVLVVGQTHGDEEGGLRVLFRLKTLALPDNVSLWVIPTMNPDGGFADTRFLADASDPNRGAPSTVEQRAVFDLAMEVRPELTVWYHQNYGWIGGSGSSRRPAQQYQQAVGMDTLNRSGDCAKGFMWCPIDDALGSSSILVELPDVMTPNDVRVHADALLAVAAETTT